MNLHAGGASVPASRSSVGLYNVRLAGTLAPPFDPQFMVPNARPNDVAAFHEPPFRSRRLGDG